MKNRKLSSPILCAVVLSLVASPLLSKADPGVSDPAYSAPATQPAPTTPTTTADATAASLAKHTAAYTVIKGDSLTSIAEKFKTTRKKLKALNGLTASTVKPGQVLLVPSLKSSKSAVAATTAKVVPKTKKHHTYLAAQPVQDFDVPASTFASCPVPLPSPDDDVDSPAPVVAEKSAPIAQLVSPAEMEADEAQQRAELERAERQQANADLVAPTPQVAATVVTPTAQNKRVPSTSSYSTGLPAIPAFNSPTQRLTAHNFIPTPSPNPMITTPASDWGNRFLQEARALGNEGIEYDEDWRPPGEPHAWTMDCSNTTRYLYKATTGIQLPRTASDQYYYLHLQGKAWDVPQTPDGWADTNFLRHNLKPGDLLFWENTYRPERQPPITHVMVFLGTNERGQWIMAGSQTSRGGEHNRANGGPDIYVFRPTQPCGGYSTWMGLVHHQGRFCAFGRPLEADRAKLAVAAND